MRVDLTMQADLDVLVGQFTISRRALDEYASVPVEWHQESLDGWYLSAHPTTRVATLTDAAGTRIGWLLGEPWCDSEMVGEELVVPEESSADLEAALYDLGGPWLAFIPGISRVYVDAFGHLSVLYSAGAETVATAPVLIEGAEPNDELRALFDIPVEDNWYPFGLTGYRNVQRLLPNHHLCLDTWEAVRHWPHAEPKPATVDEAAEEVARLMRGAVDALAGRYPLQMSLTAGYDSRTILACARSHIGEMIFTTNNSHPSSARDDIAVGRRLASRYDLTHTIGQPQEATVAERTAWLLQTGEAGAGTAYRHLRLTNAYGTGRARLSGQGGEVIRAYYHSGGTKPHASDYNADELFGLLKLPMNSDVATAAEQWREGIGDVTGRELLNLLYVEQRMGCWAGPLRWGGRSSLRVFWPVAHRRVLELMRGLPVEAMRENAIHLRIIEREWPELLALPFNEPIGLAALEDHARRLVGKARFRLGAIRRRLLPS